MAIWLSPACVAFACGSRSTLDGGAAGDAATASGSSSKAGSTAKAGGSSGGSGPATAGSPSGAGSAPPGAGGNAAAGTPTETEVPCPPGVVGHCSYTDYPARPGYTLALVEDFPTPLDLDQDETFTWSDGTHEGSQAGFRAQNLTFAGGKLSLTADTDCPPSNGNTHCYPERQSYAAALSPNRQATLRAMDVWSGELRTKYNNYRFGYYEFKATAPNAKVGSERGFHWEMKVMRDPRNVRWNQVGLSLGGDATPNVISGLVVNSAQTSDFNLLDLQWSHFEGPADLSIYQEHVYAFAWTPEKVEWLVDGKPVMEQLSSSEHPLPSLSGKVKMNLWLLTFQTNQFPLEATFDYFRFYRWNGELFYPCAPAPACLPPEDKSPSAQNNPNEVDYGL